MDLYWETGERRREKNPPCPVFGQRRVKAEEGGRVKALQNPVRMAAADRFEIGAWISSSSPSCFPWSPFLSPRAITPASSPIKTGAFHLRQNVLGSPRRGSGAREHPENILTSGTGLEVPGEQSPTWRKLISCREPSICRDRVTPAPFSCSCTYPRFRLLVAAGPEPCKVLSPAHSTRWIRSARRQPKRALAFVCSVLEPLRFVEGGEGEGQHAANRRARGGLNLTRSLKGDAPKITLVWIKKSKEKALRRESFCACNLSCRTGTSFWAARSKGRQRLSQGC